MCAITGFIQAHGVVGSQSARAISAGKRGDRRSRFRAVRGGAAQGGYGRYKGERVKTSVGVTDKTTVGVGLHQGSSLSPYLFDMILGRGIKEQPPWCMLFADDIVLCSTRREHVERKLEEWRRAMEERGLKISRKKTEYLECNEHQDAEIHLQGETVKRVKTFTYLGSILAEDGQLYTEVTQSAERVEELEESIWSVVRQENEREEQGEDVQNSGKTGTDVRDRDMGIEEGAGN